MTTTVFKDHSSENTSPARQSDSPTATASVKADSGARRSLSLASQRCSLPQITALNTLEELLAREFRVCQSLHSITKDERANLIRNDVRALLVLIEQKEALLDELGRIEDERRMAVQELSQILGLHPQTSSIRELLPKLSKPYSERYLRLCEGIAAISGQIRDFNHGNQALTLSALERVDAMQMFLLSFYQSNGLYCHSPSTGYQPSGMPTQSAPSKSAAFSDVTSPNVASPNVASPNATSPNAATPNAATLNTRPITKQTISLQIDQRA